MPVYFVDTPKQELGDILKINIAGTLRITSAVLPGMISLYVLPIHAVVDGHNFWPYRKYGLILNVGSFAGAVPSPMLATYSGSKSFLATFSSALAEEVRAHNITVQNLNTYFVVRLSLILINHSQLMSLRSKSRFPNYLRSARRLFSSPGLQRTCARFCPRSVSPAVPRTAVGRTIRRRIGLMHCWTI
jgi:NAD(P)-dependent dehydrogenase (short-subunit alcohol dehydrogenase family)